MRFRSVGRRPSRRWVAGLALLGIFPPLGARAGGEGPSPSAGVSRRSLRSDSTAVWVFFSARSWETTDPVDAVLATGARLRTRSEWLRALSVSVEPTRIDGLASIPGVEEIRPVARLGLSAPSPGESEPVYGPPPGGPMADSTHGTLGPALDLIGIPGAHGLGFEGVGTRIGILDGLFLADHETLRDRPPVATRDFVEGDAGVEPGPTELREAAAHGTALWSLVAGDRPGLLRGAAPMAGIVLARIRGEEELGDVDEDRWVQGLEWLESQGARIVVSGVTFRSLLGHEYGIEHLNGDLAASSRAADQAAQRGVLVVSPTGNRGPGPETLGAPADGDSVLAVGAVDATGGVATFSAMGPTADGRPKPELLAPGTNLPAASVQSPDDLESVDGTEFAAGLLAGAAALFIEAYPDRGPMEVLEALRTSASPRGSAHVDVPDIASAILFPDGLEALALTETDGEGWVSTLTPQFQWNAPTMHPVGLPVTFHLEVSEDSLFHSVLVRDSVVGTFARRIGRPLPPRTRLYWRVAAVSVQGIRRTTLVQGPIRVPSWISLDVLDDIGGVETEDARPEFRWTALPLQPPAGPLLFELQILSERDGEILQRHSDLKETHYRLPDPLPVNRPVRWRVIAASRTGAADTVTCAGPIVVTEGSQPPVTLLYQNFPNPFPRPDLGVDRTSIWFDLAEEATVELAVYDMRGRLVRRLVPGPGCDAAELPAGIYGRDDASGGLCASLAWNGRAEDGRRMPAGVYLLRLRAGGVVQVRHVVYWP